MGNSIAYIMIAVWPFLTVYVYATQKIQIATLWTIIGGYMFLPVKTEIDLPLLPPLGKSTIPVVSALVGIWLFKKRVSQTNQKSTGIVKWLLVLFITSPIVTVIFNGDQVFVGGRTLHGLTYHDAISTMVNQWLFIVPFVFGSQFFKTHEQHLLMFKTLVTAGLIYSILILIEIRLSPQLHSMLYGYFPHSFAQQVRDGGYRPVVFMGHGLWVAIFVVSSFVAAMALWQCKARLAKRLQSAKVVYYLLVVLILCKSMASIIYASFGLFLIKFLNVKMQMRIAVLIVFITLAYPTLSIFNLVPHQEITDIARRVSAERAQSLQFRFDNERVLLNHGGERFFFGWGGWGRNRVFNDETGQDETVTDGRWIITFGQFGWFGFIAEFGLLAMSVFRARVALRYTKNNDDRILLSAHALLVSFIMLDQLPNATLAPWLLLLAGILLGRSENIILENKKERFASNL